MGSERWEERSKRWESRGEGSRARGHGVVSTPERDAPESFWEEPAPRTPSRWPGRLPLRTSGPTAVRQCVCCVKPLSSRSSVQEAVGASPKALTCRVVLSMNRTLNSRRLDSIWGSLVTPGLPALLSLLGPGRAAVPGSS